MLNKLRLFLLLTLCVAGFTVMAQYPPISRIDVNNVSATILGDGTCLYPGGENASCPIWEVPEGGGAVTLHQHALWLGGMATDGLHLAAMRYGQEGRDYWSGPLRTDASIDLMASLRFNHVWKLTRFEIDQFIANHSNAGYQIPDDIMSWPARGDLGYAENLAPFVDVNHDGQYNPADGDYPDIRGDQCLFFIFNDSFGDHGETGGAKLGLEVHAMVYGFDDTDDEALNNTVFVNYKIFNRSSINYHDTYLGIWNDWRIGDASDDYVGCDVQRNACFAYNGTVVDGDGGVGTYGNNPPIQVLTILKSPDNLGMTGFICHPNDSSSIGNPENAQEYYYLLQNRWKDGNALMFGGTGYPGGDGTVGPECHFMFPGDSDPDNIGTGGVAPDGGYNENGIYWTEENENNTPGDRCALASVGPFDFPAGSMKELDYAMTTVWKNSSQTAMERKDAFIDHVRSFYGNTLDKEIKFVKNGLLLSLRSRLSEENDIMVTMHQYNGNITFNSVYIGSKLLSDEELASEDCLIKSNLDMIAPVGISSFWALYAQHGWSIPRMVVENPTLDDSDVGSIWKDQRDRLFSIGMVADTVIFLLPEITLGQDGIYYSSWNNSMEYPVTLTHVSGAVHSNTIEGNSSRYDLIIQQSENRRFILDGVEITDDGVYYCSRLQIQEQLFGLNIGKVETWFPIPEYNGSLIDFDRSFEFDNGMNVTCNTTLYCRYPFIITSYRGIQPQFPLQKGQYHSYTFIPKIKRIVEDHRVDIPFNSDSDTLPQIYASRHYTHLYDVDKQPERCVTYLKDDGGSYLFGMAGGCSLTRGLSVDSIRNANIHIGNNSILFGGSGSIANKFYPRLIYEDSFDSPVDTTFVAEVSGYFTWFDPNINDCLVYYYKDGDDYIVYIHAFDSLPQTVIHLPIQMEGWVVDGIIEKTEGASMLTQQVLAGKLLASFNTDADIANYIVVRLKSTWN